MTMTPKRPKGSDPRAYQHNSTLKRSTKQLKRTQLNRTPTNKQKAKDARQLKRIRAEWRKDHPRCMVCGRKFTDSVHEMVGGSKWRHLTERLPEFWLGVCDGPRGCHRKIQNDKAWPLARQLAHKAMYDPQGFDLLFVNETLVKEPDVLMSDVDSYLNQLEN